MASAGLFEPDTLVGDQWDGVFHGGSAMSSEKRLMLAVLKNALQSYQKYAFSHDHQQLQLFEEVADWIDCEHTEWFFSFRNICENLEINPAHLRRRLLEWREQGPHSETGC